MHGMAPRAHLRKIFAGLDMSEHHATLVPRDCRPLGSFGSKKLRCGTHLAPACGIYLNSICSIAAQAGRPGGCQTLLPVACSRHVLFTLVYPMSSTFGDSRGTRDPCVSVLKLEHRELCTWLCNGSCVWSCDKPCAMPVPREPRGAGPHTRHTGRRTRETRDRPGEARRSTRHRAQAPVVGPAAPDPGSTTPIRASERAEAGAQRD